MVKNNIKFDISWIPRKSDELTDKFRQNNLDKII